MNHVYIVWLIEPVPRCYGDCDNKPDKSILGIYNTEHGALYSVNRYYPHLEIDKIRDLLANESIFEGLLLERHDLLE